MALVYAVARISALWDEVCPLTVAHAAEVNGPTSGLSLDRTSYEQAERTGAHLLVTARDDAGVLAGYLSLFLRPHLHNATPTAYQDGIYLRPEHRAGWNASGLIACADAALRDRGVSVVYHYAPIAHDYGAVLRQLGYNPTEIVWCRHLHQGEAS